MIPPAAISFLKSYWKEAAIALLIASLTGYIYILRIQKENITLSFDNFKLATIQVVRDREKEIDIQRIQSNNRKAANEQVYAKQVEAMQEEIKRLAGSNAGLVSVNAGLLDAADSTRRALSEMVKSSRASSRRGGDCNIQLENKTRELKAMTLACTQTTIDYDELRLWAKDNCEIYGCE